MSIKDRELLEDLTMSLAAYVHSIALISNEEFSDRRRYIDAAWEEFKMSAGRLFTKAESE